MLIKKPLDNGSIVSIKLISGEEIYAKLIESDANKITVIRPILIVIQQQGAGILNYMNGADDDEKIDLNRNTVVAMVRARKEFSDLYIQATSSIQPASSMPNSGLIV